MKSITAIAVSAAIALAGCASSSKDIAAISVSPLQYNSYDCTQLEAENARLATRISQLGGRLDEAASNDKAIMGVGMILFWPALFALGGTKEQEAEYAKVKGEYDALQQTAIMKKCGLQTKTLDASATQPNVATVQDQAKPTNTAPAAVATN